VVGLAITDTLRALATLTAHQPVSCCAAVYDQVRRTPAAAPVSDSVWVWLTAAGGALLIVLGVLLRRARPAWQRRLAGGLGVLSIAWVGAATLALVRVLAAYHYGVLHHHCPWCLFLPDHHGVGFAAFAALAWAACEGPAAWLATATARRCELLAAAATARARAAGWHLTLAVALFALVAGLPALVYRLRFGTWLDGGL
jgi:hypothetical protein